MKQTIFKHFKGFINLMVYNLCSVYTDSLISYTFFKVYRGLNAEAINATGIPMFELKPFNENVVYDAYYKMLSAVSDWG